MTVSRRWLLCVQYLAHLGWVTLVVAVLQLFAGYGALAGNQLARWFGMAVVGLNAIAQMFFIPASPWWSLVIIALDIVALYGLCVYGGPRRPTLPRSPKRWHGHGPWPRPRWSRRGSAGAARSRRSVTCAVALVKAGLHGMMYKSAVGRVYT